LQEGVGKSQDGREWRLSEVAENKYSSKKTIKNAEGETYDAHPKRRTRGLQVNLSRLQVK